MGAAVAPPPPLLFVWPLTVDAAVGLLVPVGADPELVGAPEAPALVLSFAMPAPAHQPLEITSSKRTDETEAKTIFESSAYLS